MEEKVVLNQSDNAWKPATITIFKGTEDENGEKDEKAVLERKWRAILNKLTPQNFETLVNKFKELDIDNESKLQMCVELFFEKAVDEPSFSVAYAKMCEVLKNKEVTSNDTGRPVNFKKIYIKLCQKEFYRDYMDGLDKTQYDADMAVADSDEKRKEIQDDFERLERRRRLGTISLIGELYKLKMLSVNIIHCCVQWLLRPPPNQTHIIEVREVSLECLCKLLTTVGQELEIASKLKTVISDYTKGSQTTPQEVQLDIYFAEIQNIINGRQSSTRVRFMLQDLTDLRRNKWTPRREFDHNVEGMVRGACSRYLAG